MSKKKKTIHPKYKEYLKKREGEVKERTLYLLERVFNEFPAPSKLTGDFFRSYLNKKTGKPLAPSTLQHYITTAKHYLKWSGLSKEEIDKRIDYKPKKADETITADMLYTPEELKRIINATMNTRDRAIIEVLYETATRAGELLAITFDDIVFEEIDPESTDKPTAIITIKAMKSKRDRDIPIQESLPSLKAWITAHPTKEGPLWVSTNEPFAPIKYAGLYRMVELSIKRAKIKRKVKSRLHNFRHSRITEWVRLGVDAEYIKYLAGWTSITMLQVYSHLSSVDVVNEVKQKVFGHKGEKKEPKQKPLESPKCSECDTVNPYGSFVCEKCNRPLTQTAKTLQRIQVTQELTDRLKEQEDKIKRLEGLVEVLYDSVLVKEKED